MPYIYLVIYFNISEVMLLSILCTNFASVSHTHCI